MDAQHDDDRPHSASGAQQPRSARSQTAKASRPGFRPIAGGVLVVALAAFVVQNRDPTAVSWLWFDGSAPLYAVIVVSACAGALLSELVGWMIRRRRRRQS